MNGTDKVIISLKENKFPLVLLIVYTVSVVFFCSKISPLYPLNEWSDINLYFNIGKALFNGKVLYLDVFDHKGPFIFFLYGVGYLISNDSFFGMFIIECITWVILSFTAYYTAKLFLKGIYPLLVAVAFLPLFLSHTEKGGSAEEFIIACIAVSFYLFIRYFRNPGEHNPYHMVIHGLMWGIVLLTKFTLTAFWIPLLLSVALILLQQRRYKNLFINILSFLLGGLIVFLPILLYFVVNDGLGKAIECYISVNMTQTEGSSSILENLVVRFYQRLRFETIEFSILLLGAIGFPLLMIKNNIAKIGIVLGFFALFTIAFMLTYFHYYSIPYYIYGILGFIVIAFYFSKYISIKPVWHLAVVFSAIGLFVSIGRTGFFGTGLKVLLRMEEPIGVMYQFAEVIEKEENPTLLNLSLDEINSVFTISNIVPNVRYFITPNLNYDQHPEMRDEQDKYIKNKDVEFVVLSTKSRNYEHFKSFEPFKENYGIVDSCEISYYGKVDKVFYLYKLKK